MGNIVSDITSGIDGVVSSVTKGITDVGSAVTGLTSIASSLMSVVPVAVMLDSPGRRMSSYTVTQSDANDLNSALKSAMGGALSAAKKMFASQFPNSSPAGFDNGVVMSYVSGQGVSCVVAQMTQDFQNWEIDADTDTIAGMAATIAQQISSQGGFAGTAQGHHNIDANQQINWAVAYGIFTTGLNQKGLVYAYTASLDGGFGN